MKPWSLSAARRATSPGFTLAEVLIGVFILTLVVSAVYFTLWSSLEALHAGKALMDQYQEARIGTNRLVSDIRQAASPNQYWQDLARHAAQVDEHGNPLPPPPGIDPDRGKIIFKGDAQLLSFVRKEVIVEREQPYDLVEVRLFFDPETRTIRRTRAKSVLGNQMVMWREAYLTQTLGGESGAMGSGGSETRFRGRAARDDDQGPLDYHMTLPDHEYQPTTEVLLRNAAGLRFAYYDGERWQDHWDSTEPLEDPQAEPYDPASGNPTPTPNPETRGLPAAVEVRVDFVAATRTSKRGGNEGDLLTRTFLTRSFLPHSNLNMAETPFVSKREGGKRGLRKKPSRRGEIAGGEMRQRGLGEGRR